MVQFNSAQRRPLSVQFAEKVSREWDRFGSNFTAEGQTVELPESVVPEAYREWEFKVFDWQTQCPTLAETLGNSPSLTYRSIKLFPTVGCETDAATVYTSDERNIFDASAFTYASTGCYVAEQRIDSVSKSVELEHCLIDPTNKKSRVRVIQVLNLQEFELKLVRIKVFVEQWYAPFQNDDQLRTGRDNRGRVHWAVGKKTLWDGLNYTIFMDYEEVFGSRSRMWGKRSRGLYLRGESAP
ncbi:uncharacterized protein LOC131023414 [Salvia miltiorrhiza]|uniref:uncharacterized protein LOC131023414 n=1 Tax=Salvia miltiorrhiza TaxID=226208 RepID=UPI0025AD7E0B|nr:uncharacterized protein LOC131023414 [Salvia miltiorrhiza]